MELEHVLLFFRHGDRSPITSHVGEHLTMTDEDREYWIQNLCTTEQKATAATTTTIIDHDSATPPSFAPYNQHMWPNGQLTSKGAHFMQQKGQKLRQRYADFIKSTPTEEIHVRSTNMQRTIESAQHLLLGLFPIDENTKQVIPIKTRKTISLAPKHSRAKEMALIDKMKQDRPPEHSAFEQTVRQILGIPLEKALDFSAIRENLVCRYEHQLPLPKGMTEELYRNIIHYNSLEWEAVYSDVSHCREAFAQGMEEMVDMLRSAKSKTTPYKLSLFSAHDTSLSAFLHALQVPQKQIPTYGTICAIELLRDSESGEHFLKMFIDDEPAPLHPQASSAHIHFDKFDQIVNKWMDSSSKKE